LCRHRSPSTSSFLSPRGKGIDAGTEFQDDAIFLLMRTLDARGLRGGLAIF
jgi:hypothetical protein